MPIEGEYEPSPSAWVRDQIEEYEASGGTRANTLRQTGIPVIVVSMRGRKSGKVRKIALMRVEHEGCYAIVASIGGAPTNPQWYANLLADPNISIQDGAVAHDFVAREISGDEKATWWQRGVDVFANYAEYQSKTDREIPVLIAEPVA